MTTPEFERRLRLEMRQEAGRIRPSVDDAWSRVGRRLANSTRRRARPIRIRWLLVPSAAVAVVALVAALAVARPQGDRPMAVEVGPADSGADHADADGRRERGGYVGPFEGIFPATSWEEYDRLQDGLAEGRQRWVADAEQVARSYLAGLLGTEERGELRALDPLVAEYRWKGGRVVLWRYGPGGSAWVVTAADADDVEVGIGDYRRGLALHVNVLLARPGSVTVRAGTFAAEWIAEHTASLAGGSAADARLTLGLPAAPGPDAVLVDVDVQFADGGRSRAQYRANAMEPSGAGEDEPAVDHEGRPVELSADGLGVVRFGASPDGAVRSLSAILGRPDEDTGWTSYSKLQPALGQCGGTEWRLVRWGQLGVLFTDDGDSPYVTDGARHFEAYSYGGFKEAPPGEPALVTPEGLALGHTYRDAEARYGSGATFHPGDEVQPPTVRIDAGGGNPLVATVDGRTATAAIVEIRGGDPCGE